MPLFSKTMTTYPYESASFDLRTALDSTSRGASLSNSVAYLHKSALEDEMASVVMAHETNKAGKKAKREQLKTAAPITASGATKDGKRQATAEVIELKRRENLGLKDLGAVVDLGELGYFDASYLTR